MPRERYLIDEEGGIHEMPEPRTPQSLSAQPQPLSERRVSVAPPPAPPPQGTGCAVVLALLASGLAVLLLGILIALCR